jgi:hypothetical protein
MTYKISILRLDGSIFESEMDQVFDFTKMKGYYTNPEVINTKFVNVCYNRTSGDIEEVFYKEVELEK